MIENNFNNRDFERFVKRNADQYRMFPSDKVWKGIHNTLHPRRRWYGIGLALLLLATASVTFVMLMTGDKQGKLASTIGSLAVKEKINSDKNTITIEPAIALINTADQRDDKTYPTHLKENYLSSTNPAPVNSNGDQDADQFADIISDGMSNFDMNPVASRDIVKKNIQLKNNYATAKDVNLELAMPVTTYNNEPVITTINTEEKTTVTPGTENEAGKNVLMVPFTIESVVNSYINRPGKKKWGWELYLTPIVSYRTLSENTEFISMTRYNSIITGGTGNSPSYYSTNVNSVVNHKPNFGFKVGVKASYPVSKWFSITTGFQLGVSKYEIKAYQHTSEPATIALSTAIAGSNSVTTMSNYRNGNGQKVNWLSNFYFAASVPVGMELKLSDGTKNYFGISTTLQPTYVLDNRAYLISTDYKNYAEVPSLTRRFNLNASFEIYSAHTTGKIKWRIGPQVHYQVMSSFVKNYPIKEHLFDFGLKLGVQLR